MNGRYRDADAQGGGARPPHSNHMQIQQCQIWCGVGRSVVRGRIIAGSAGWVVGVVRGR